MGRLSRKPNSNDPPDRSNKLAKGVDDQGGIVDAMFLLISGSGIHCSKCGLVEYKSCIREHYGSKLCRACYEEVCPPKESKVCVHCRGTGIIASPTKCDYFGKHQMLPDRPCPFCDAGKRHEEE